MNELLYKEEVFQLIGFCMEIHRELEKGPRRSHLQGRFSR